MYLNPMENFLNPTEVINKLDLKKNMVVADFGSGSGGWAIPLAKKLEDGKVFAIDILEEPLSALKAKIKLEKIFNIEVIKSNLEKTSRLFKNSCDLVLMTNLLFEVEDIKKILEEGKRALKKGGKILIVDWKKEAPFGPKEKVLIEEIKEVVKKVDLKLEKEFEVGTYHWGLILVK
jgi:ubiquinone/menaquinone biosynthesis C-methylase UbiE